MLPLTYIIAFDDSTRVKDMIKSISDKIEIRTIKHIFQQDDSLSKIKSSHSVFTLQKMTSVDYFSLYSEIGEYAAHIKALEDFIQSEEEECLIVDDISTIRKDFINVWLNVRLNLPSLYDIVSLSGEAVDNKIYSTAYLIRKECAKKLLHNNVHNNPHAPHVPSIFQLCKDAEVNIITTTIPLFLIEPHNYNIAFSEKRQNMIVEHQKYNFGNFMIKNCRIEIITWGIQEGVKKSNSIYLV